MNRQSTAARFRAAARDAPPQPQAPGNQPFMPFSTAFAWGRAMRDSGMTFDQMKAMADRNPVFATDPTDWAAGFMGSPRAVHFVGFRGDEFARAVRVFGKPDFVHRHSDPRFRDGGEFAPHDTVVFANGSEAKPSQFSFDDSAVM